MERHSGCRPSLINGRSRLWSIAKPPCYSRPETRIKHCGLYTLRRSSEVWGCRIHKASLHAASLHGSLTSLIKRLGRPRLPKTSTTAQKKNHCVSYRYIPSALFRHSFGHLLSFTPTKCIPSGSPSLHTPKKEQQQQHALYTPLHTY